MSVQMCKESNNLLFYLMNHSDKKNEDKCLLFLHFKWVDYRLQKTAIVSLKIKIKQSVQNWIMIKLLLLDFDK